MPARTHFDPHSSDPELYFRVPRPTHREIEVKLPVSDIRALVRKLRNLGATNRGRVFEQNTLYDTPDSALRRTRRLLRLRVETPARAEWSRAGSRQCVITSKAPPESTRSKRSRPKSRYKERLERETSVSHSEPWPQILTSLGLRSSFVYEKFRTSFRLPGLHLDLDETPAGIFLELEGSAKAINRIAKSLGYSARDYFTGTYWDVYAADCRRRGVALKNMVFDRKKLPKSALFA
jgi:adenylate cyclase class 2